MLSSMLYHVAALKKLPEVGCYVKKSLFRRDSILKWRQGFLQKMLYICWTIRTTLATLMVLKVTVKQKGLLDIYLRYLSHPIR